MKSLIVFNFVILTIVLINAQKFENNKNDVPIEYEFHYSVHDDNTKDIKSHREHRKDDKVEGSYELIDSDGFKRLVEYKSDDKNGFTAVVHREPTDIKIPIPENQAAEESILHEQKIILPVKYHEKYVPYKIVKVVRSASKYHYGLPHSVGQNRVSFHGSEYAYNY